jgi:hypothetical protein
MTDYPTKKEYETYLNVCVDYMQGRRNTQPRLVLPANKSKKDVADDLRRKMRRSARESTRAA